MKTWNLAAGLVVLCVNLTLQAGSEPLVELVPVGAVSFPVAVENAGDGSGRLFVIELSGRIWILQDDNVLSEPFLDIRDRVDQVKEGGLLGLAFHPEFSENRRFFVFYTQGQEGNVKAVISEFGVSTQTPNRALADERVVLEMERPTAIHHGGDLAFGSDGYLYISSGDGGPGGDPDGRGQDLKSLLGKILRIDVDRGDAYAIPEDNPFVGLPGRDEIWAYGFRNPFRFAFDRLTGRLFAGDVGQVSFEEVDLIRKGGNYGWRILEGDACFIPPEDCDREGLIPPLATYGREEGQAVIGGQVYRGNQATSLTGKYIFGDFVSRRLFVLSESFQGRWQRRRIHTTGHSAMFTSFGSDESGELFATGLLENQVFRLKFGERLIFPQIVDGLFSGGSYSFTLYLSNPGPEAVTARVRFFDRSGLPSALVTNLSNLSEFEVVIPAESIRPVTSAGSSLFLFAGWAEVTADRPLEGSILFRSKGPDSRLRAQAGLPAASTHRHIVVPVERDDDQGLDLGVVLLNPFIRDNANVTFELWDDSEGLVGEYSFLLLARGQRAFFVGELPGAPDKLSGRLVIQSTSELAAGFISTVEGLPDAGITAPGN